MTQGWDKLHEFVGLYVKDLAVAKEESIKIIFNYKDNSKDLNNPNKHKIITLKILISSNTQLEDQILKEMNKVIVMTIQDIND